MKTYRIAGVVGIVLIISALILFSQGDTAQGITLKDPMSAEAAPDFTISDLSGNQVSLSENIDSEKPTIIYFMASWCPTCAKNWEALSVVYPEFKDDVSFISVSVDPTDTKQVLSKLAEKKGFLFPVSKGNAELAREYKVYSQTTKVAIDSTGKEVYRGDGSLSEDEWRDLFSKLS